AVLTHGDRNRKVLLDGYFALQLCIAGVVGDAEAAVAQDRNQLIVPQPRASGEHAAHVLPDRFPHGNTSIATVLALPPINSRKVYTSPKQLDEVSNADCAPSAFDANGSTGSRRWRLAMRLRGAWRLRA